MKCGIVTARNSSKTQLDIEQQKTDEEDFEQIGNEQTMDWGYYIETLNFRKDKNIGKELQIRFDDKRKERREVQNRFDSGNRKQKEIGKISENGNIKNKIIDEDITDKHLQKNKHNEGEDQKHIEFENKDESKVSRNFMGVVELLLCHTMQCFINLSVILFILIFKTLVYTVYLLLYLVFRLLLELKNSTCYYLKTLCPTFYNKIENMNKKMKRIIRITAVIIIIVFIVLEAANIIFEGRIIVLEIKDWNYIVYVRVKLVKIEQDRTYLNRKTNLQYLKEIIYKTWNYIKPDEAIKRKFSYTMPYFSKMWKGMKESVKRVVKIRT